MILKPLTMADAEQIRIWRNEQLQNLRTKNPLTKKEQAKWYIKMVEDDTQAWWGVWIADELYGYTGLQKIKNGTAEISMLFRPGFTGEEGCFPLLCNNAFLIYGLDKIYGAVYTCSTKYDIWLHLITKYKMNHYVTAQKKLYKGYLYPIIYYEVARKEYENVLLHTGTKRKQAISWQKSCSV